MAKDSDVIRAGLIGCGGRGTGAAENCLESDPRVELVAMGDFFQENLDKSFQNLGDPNREGGALKGFKVTKDKCFAGIDAYRKVLATDIDLVLLATPPGFRPIHVEAAVEAGKHIFAEKPVAVDPVGVRRIIAAGEKAKQKKLGFLAGTQYRHNPGMIEAMKKIHDGEIGEIRTARAYFNSGGVWFRPRKEGMSDFEYQIWNWYYFDWLSGDHIVEQHVHTIDATNWALQALPIRAVGTGGRQVRTDEKYGNIFDHFCIDYEYPNGVHVMSMCRHWAGTDSALGLHVVGSKGESHPYESPYLGGKAAYWAKQYVQEHADLLKSIREGNPINEARQVAESSLTGIMGRQAAYTGQIVTWEEMMASDLDLSPEKYENGPLPVHPIPVPGAGRPVVKKKNARKQ